ncbi:MAG TPA: ribosomal protein S18-alanine N-acetyltransferase [Candidatus Krumholzibacteria bacterium]|nr:ribosomal protein S18-alanine N-acetyltransferase [Candidatus Krumholzibacteria bacterium]
MDVETRPATRGDLEAILAVERASFPAPWSRDALAAELQGDPRRMPMVAVHAGKVVGFALVWVIADEVHLVNLAVLPDHRRRGIAQQLLDAVLDTEAGRRAAIMTLEVRVGNDEAIAFYRRNGFVDVAFRPRYYPDTHEDALVMLKPLRERRADPGGRGSGPGRN